jgi:hypothetical protein
LYKWSLSARPDGRIRLTLGNAVYHPKFP